jgi:hypothetical protein
MKWEGPFDMKVGRERKTTPIKVAEDRYYLYQSKKITNFWSCWDKETGTVHFLCAWTWEEAQAAAEVRIRLKPPKRDNNARRTPSAPKRPAKSPDAKAKPMPRPKRKAKV